MWGQLGSEIEDWHIWKIRKLQENHSVKSFLPEKLQNHLPLYTDLGCLLSETSPLADTGTNDVLMSLNGQIYSGLLSHLLISVQPLVGNWMAYAGDGENYHRVSVPSSVTVKIGDGWDELEIKEVLEVGGHELLAEIVCDLSASCIRGWDGFVFRGLEKAAGSWCCGPCSDTVSTMLDLKNNSENATGLPINRIIVSKEVQDLIKRDSWFFSISEPLRYASGNLIGRWRGADVYSTNLLSSKTSVLMLHRGNTQYDSPFVLVVESIGRPGSMLWWGRGAIYGQGERSLGWSGAEKSIIRIF